MFDVEIWGTVSDWVSAIFTMLGVLGAFYAFVDWKSAQFNQQQLTLYSDLLEKVSTLLGFVSELPEGAETFGKAVKVRGILRETLTCKSHLLDDGLTGKLSLALQAADHCITTKTSGTDTPEDFYEFWYRAQELQEILTAKLLPYRWLLVFRRKQKRQEKIRAIIKALEAKRRRR